MVPQIRPSKTKRQHLSFTLTQTHQTRSVLKVTTTFLGIIDGKDTNASGILQSINQAFVDINIPLNNVGKIVFSLVPMVHQSIVGDLNSVISLMQEKYPWVIFMWCIAHRLELSLKDSLTDTCFTHRFLSISSIFVILYKSPKKLRKLRDFADLYSASLEKTFFRQDSAKKFVWDKVDCPQMACNAQCV